MFAGALLLPECFVMSPAQTPPSFWVPITHLKGIALGPLPARCWVPHLGEGKQQTPHSVPPALWLETGSRVAFLVASATAFSPGNASGLALQAQGTHCQVHLPDSRGWFGCPRRGSTQLPGLLENADWFFVFLSHTRNPEPRKIQETQSEEGWGAGRLRSLASTLGTHTVADGLRKEEKVIVWAAGSGCAAGGVGLGRAWLYLLCAQLVQSLGAHLGWPPHSESQLHPRSWWFPQGDVPAGCKDSREMSPVSKMCLRDVVRALQPESAWDGICRHAYERAKEDLDLGGM